MRKIAKFHKVSLKQFIDSWKDTFPQTAEEEINEIYENLRLPRRATAGSAGYDFFTPVDVTLEPAKPQRFLPASVQRWQRALCLCCFREAVLVLSTACS